MYIVHDLTRGMVTECDAIEYITVAGDGYAPAEQDVADGFKALVNSADNTEVVSETVYAFEGHTLHGTEPAGSFEVAPEEESEE